MKGDAEHAAKWVNDGEYLFEVLPSCGCGDPDGVFELCKRVLEEADKKGAKRSLCEVAREGGNDDPLTWAFVATLDREGLLEHGTTIRYSWLTPLGKAVLSKLQLGWAEQTS